MSNFNPHMRDGGQKGRNMKSVDKIKKETELEKSQQELYDVVCRSIDQNAVVFVIALARYARYGQKRLNDFLAVLNDVVDEYHQYCLDGVFDIMADRELKSRGLTIDQLMPPALPFKLEYRRSRDEIKRHANVDIGTAKKLQKNLTNFTNCIQVIGGKNNG